MMSARSSSTLAPAMLGIALMTLGVVSGCGDIRCPADTLAQGDACVCASGARLDEVSGDCAPEPRPDASGGSRDPIERPTSMSPEATTPTVNAGGVSPLPAAPDAAMSAPLLNPDVARDAASLPPAPVPTSGSGATAGPNMSMPAVGATDYCDDGNTDPYDGCINHRVASCGDGILRFGVEECEVGFGAGWTSDNCVRCERQRYRTCSSHEECLHRTVKLPDGELRYDACIYGICTPFGCDNSQCSIPCPQLGGYEVSLQTIYCMLPCTSDAACPRGTRCDGERKFCIAQDYSPEHDP